MAKTSATTTSPGLLARWREVLRTSNPPAGRLDPMSKWLVLTRASVLPMTLTAGAVAGLLAVNQPGFRPDVLAVWGPLMVGGTYYAAVGHLPWHVLLASIPYGLLCTTVLMGKHIDKAEWDAPQGTRTLPVLLGDRRARRVTQGLMATFYVSLAVLVGIGALPWPTLLAYAALPALVKVWRAFDRPRPDQPPPRFPVWPLWFA